MEAAKLTYRKGKCLHCDGPLEFPEELVGESIECPHCHGETPLFDVPKTPTRRRPKWIWKLLAAVSLCGLIFWVTATFLRAWYLVMKKEESMRSVQDVALNAILISAAFFVFMALFVWSLNIRRFFAVAASIFLLLGGFFLIGGTSFDVVAGLMLVGFGFLLFGVQAIIWAIQSRSRP